MTNPEDKHKGGEVKQFRAIAGKCPICKKPAIVDHRPFCSKRCAQIDLGRWFGEVYRAPVDDEDWSESEVWSASTSPPRDER